MTFTDLYQYPDCHIIFCLFLPLLYFKEKCPWQEEATAQVNNTFISITCEYAVYFQQNDGLQRLKGHWVIVQTPTDTAHHLNNMFYFLNIQKEKKKEHNNVFPDSLLLHMKYIWKFILA